MVLSVPSVSLLQIFREAVAAHEGQFKLLWVEGGREGQWAEYLIPEDMQNELPSDNSQLQSPGVCVSVWACVCVCGGRKGSKWGKRSKTPEGSWNYVWGTW